MNSKKFYETKIYCCFCGKFILISDLEKHIIEICHIEYEKILEEKIPIPRDFQILFLKINRGDFNFVVKPNILERINQKALRKYEELYIAVKTMKNNFIYKNKFNSILRDKNIIDEEYFIKEAVSLILSKFSSYNLQKMNSKCSNKIDLIKTRFITDFKKLVCFICGISYIINEYEKHLKCCYESKINRYMEDMCINSKSFIIEEILIEKDKEHHGDICYIFYLIKQYNKNCKIIYQKILEETEITTQIKKEELERQRQKMEELSKSISVFDEKDENIHNNQLNDMKFSELSNEQSNEFLLKEIKDEENLKLISRIFVKSVYQINPNEVKNDYQKHVNKKISQEELEDKKYLDKLKKQVKNFNLKRVSKEIK